MTKPKPKLKGLLYSDEAWTAMDLGHMVRDNTTGLKYRLQGGRLEVQDPLGDWEPNHKPVEWFMITMFKVCDDD